MRHLIFVLLVSSFIFHIVLASNCFFDICIRSTSSCTCPDTYVEGNTCYYNVSDGCSCESYSTIGCTVCGGDCCYSNSDDSQPTCGDRCPDPNDNSKLKVNGNPKCTVNGWNCSYTDYTCDSSNKNVVKSCGGNNYVCTGTSWVKCADRETNCNDEIDDDCDGKIDYCDSDCSCNGCVDKVACECYSSGSKADIDGDGYDEICCNGRWRDCSPPEGNKKDCECCSNSDCDDGNPCTNDVCNNYCLLYTSPSPRDRG